MSYKKLLILTIIFGLTGYQRFITKKYGSGIFMLFTLGGLYILWI